MIIYVTMKDRIFDKKHTCIYLDEKTRKLLDEYGEKYALSRSAVARMAINDFFLRQEEIEIEQNL